MCIAQIKRSPHVIELFPMLASGGTWTHRDQGRAFLMEVTSLTKMEGEESRDVFRVPSLLWLHQGWVKEEDLVWGRLKEGRTDGTRECRDAPVSRHHLWY